MSLEKYTEELTNLQAISGFEDDVKEYIKERASEMGYKFKEDFMKNVEVFIPGKRHDVKIGLFAHTDEVGLMVTRIKEDEGILKFTTVGGVDARVLLGKRVRVGKDVKGVIGFKPFHLQKKDEKPSIEGLCIFVGEDAKKVKIGDPVFFETKFSSCKDSYMGKAFDDRVGCAVMLEIMKDVKNPPFDTHLVFVSQEEVGLRGSAVAAARVNPDVALVVEGTTAGDNPELEEEHWATHLGDGPVLVAVHSGYVIDERIFEFLTHKADEKGIPYQIKRRTAGGTDAARISRTFSGIPTGVVAVPARYIHSPLSLIKKSDLENTYRLVKAFVESEVLPL